MSDSPNLAPSSPSKNRLVSIDAARGIVMGLMIFTNDLTDIPRVPRWLEHFGPGDGLTLKDLIFPAFLFIVGMSIPLALGPRLNRGERWPAVLGHVAVRALSLLFLGIIMLHESPDAAALGWSPDLWTVLFYLLAIVAFGEIKSRPRLSSSLRKAGLAAVLILAWVFRGSHGSRIFTLVPLSVDVQWYGILGEIGWAYLVASIVFLCFRGQRTALLGSAVLLMCLYPADSAGMFSFIHFVKVGGQIGSRPSIAVAGILLGTAMTASDIALPGQRFRFTLLFILGFAAAAVLVRAPYGIHKNEATPAYCLWACASAASLWLVCWWFIDRGAIPGIGRPLASAGRNVLLAYLLSEGLNSFLSVIGLGRFYDALAVISLPCALARSAACAVALLAITSGINRLGFRVRL